LKFPDFWGILEGIGGWLYEEIVRNQKIADFNAADTLAAKSGRLTVAPIGDFDGTETVWPASSSSSEIAFSVGGTTQEGTSRWANSALSAVDDPDDGTLDLVAPAEDVFSTLNHKQPGEPKYGSQNSTVGSAAMAAGVASLLKGIAPNMVGDGLRQVLQRTADDIPPAGYDKQTGHGRLDAKDAVQYVQERSFTRGTVTNGSVTVVDDNFATFTMLGGPWTSLASGKYDIGEQYKVEWTIDLPQGSDHDIWIRHPGTKGWSAANPATGHPWADIEIRSWESEATITTYGYQGYTYDILGRTISTYGYPVKAEDAKVAYTIATKPGTPPPPPLEVTLSGPTVLDEGEQGTWTAPASRDGASYTWFVDQGNGWSHLGTGSPITWSKDRISSTLTVDLKVEASEGNETATARAEVIINSNDGTPGCDSGGGGRSPNRICYADGSSLVLRNVRAETHPRNTATVMWQADGRPLPSEFVLQHRADSTGAWSTLGTVPASDSARTNASRAAAYRYQTGTLEIGTHQFRVGLPRGAALGPRAAGTSDPESARRYAEPVTATITMDEAYRLSTYPNPVRGRATVELAVKERQNVQVRLYDLLGRQVATLHNSLLPAQELRRLRLDVSATGLTSGTYFLRVRGEGFATTEQITVVR